MSDTAPPRDVDEVQASKRGLVGDGSPGPLRSAASAGPDRLILTPALRVAEPDSGSGAAPMPAGPSAGQVRPPAPEARSGVADDVASLEQRIAELEAAVAGCDDDWEPDGSETLAAATGWARPGPVAAASPPVAASASGRPATDVAPPAKAADEGNEADALVLDEAMLRELVAEILREELQGRLGERITLNVRKLVRREINRALAQRDVE